MRDRSRWVVLIAGNFNLNDLALDVNDPPNWLDQCSWRTGMVMEIVIGIIFGLNLGRS